jgi:pimeloyl-ACP methyl ester carboxylesterase
VLAATPVTGATTERLQVTVVGESGPRVVFLHGLFGQGRNWTAVAKAISPVARAVLVDLPNHGRSPWTDHFSYPEMADQLADLLQADGSGDAYAVVGHSMGGKVAMVLALRHRELVARLMVVDVSPVPTSEISHFARYVEGMRSIDLAGLTDRAQAESELAPYVPDPGIRNFLLQNLRRGSASGEGWRWQMNLDLLGDHLEEMGGWPDLAVTPYDGPVLWLAGANSDYVRPEYAPRMRSLFPRVQLVTIKHAGHWLHTDQPAVFLSVLRRFLHL